ncbi:MAG: hypothetical protein C4524_13510 [Candidatus Zixiibacteriota bacterium]|nr:MAG: hypothetical protein C4524_13510 [candidate division Zixibacteria bacterium]
MVLQDITIQCATCGRDFLFTAKEQEFFSGKGFKEPRHCRECRQQRKTDREQAIAQATGQPLQPGREMFQVICANCHRPTMVPFKPITGKPVLCKDCFIAQRYGSSPAASQEAISVPLASAPAESLEPMVAEAAESGDIHLELDALISSAVEAQTPKPSPNAPRSGASRDGNGLEEAGYALSAKPREE